MTVQDIVDSVSIDMRQVLSNIAPDANIIIPWVDRIHKDALHTSLFNYLLRDVTTVSVVQGTSHYTIAPSGGASVRRILSVYDRTFDRVILPYDDIGFPVSKGDASTPQGSDVPKALLTAATMDQWPEYYLREGATNLTLFPAPQKAAFAGTYEVHYEKQAANLTALSDTLLVPDDGKDLIVAGVNMYAALYLKNTGDATGWQQQYEMMKKGIFVG
jgi:hypothetical protein